MKKMLSGHYKGVAGENMQQIQWINTRCQMKNRMLEEKTRKRCSNSMRLMSQTSRGTELEWFTLDPGRPPKGI